MIAASGPCPLLVNRGCQEIGLDSTRRNASAALVNWDCGTRDKSRLSLGPRVWNETLWLLLDQAATT
jgi:hypothetical protein